jgi:hypothetical protein
MVSADGKKIPVLLSPLGLMDGALVVPAETTYDVAVTTPTTLTPARLVNEPVEPSELKI